MPDEAVLISITQRGYIKRVAAKAFRAQSRGGRGVTGHATKEEDEVLMLIPARTLDTILFFSDRGKVYSEKAYQIPDADRTGRGIPIVNVLSLEPARRSPPPWPCRVSTDERLLHHGDPSTGGSSAWRCPNLPRCALPGLIAIDLDEGDELGWARLTSGNDEIILVTEQGQALRFSKKTCAPWDARPAA